MRALRLAAVALAVAACSTSTSPVGESSTTTSGIVRTTTTVGQTTTTTTSRAPATTTTAPPTTTSTLPELTPPPVPTDGTLCDLYREPIVAGRILDTGLLEISGIAASRTHDGVIWAVNDSGDGPVVYAVEDGETIAELTLNAVFPIDWEDLDIGPGPGGRQYLYVGDVGDNLGFRPWISIFRLEEPDPAAGDATADAEELELVFPDLDAIDAEAMAVDPLTGDVIVIPKRRDEVGVYLVRGTDLEGRVTMERVATLDLGAEITAAAFSPNGDRLVLRGYRTIWVWPRLDLDVAGIFASGPCEAPSPTERQGEALTVLDDGSIVTISEGGRPDINVVPVAG